MVVLTERRSISNHQAVAPRVGHVHSVAGRHRKPTEIGIDRRDLGVPVNPAYDDQIVELLAVRSGRVSKTTGPALHLVSKQRLLVQVMRCGDQDDICCVECVQKLLCATC